MAEKKLVRLRYDFEFDPSEAWTRRSEFDNFLSKFLKDHGFEAEIVDYVGSASEVLYRIRKISMVSVPTSPKRTEKSESVARQLKKVVKSMPKPRKK